MNKLHLDLLLALRGAGEFGAAAEDLLTDMRRGRHRTLTQPALELALRHLGDRSFAHLFDSTLGAKRWRISGLGASALEEEGL